MRSKVLQLIGQVCVALIVGSVAGIMTDGFGAYWNWRDRKSTRLNSSHGYNSYAVFCLKKKTHVRQGLVDRQACARDERRRPARLRVLERPDLGRSLHLSVPHRRGNLDEDEAVQRAAVL